MKTETLQAIRDQIAESHAPLTQHERTVLWPESQYGGDGPWNNYGEEGAPPAYFTPFIWVSDCPTDHDFF